jgi:hypothetical protein
VSISKDASSTVVGASFVFSNATTISNAGTAYLLDRTKSTTTNTMVEWTQTGKFVAADGDENNCLGTFFAMENTIAVVGAPGYDFGTGSVYVVDMASGQMSNGDPVSISTWYRS